MKQRHKRGKRFAINGEHSTSRQGKRGAVAQGGTGEGGRIGAQPLPMLPVAGAHVLDFSGGMFEPNRQATPEQVLMVLRQASCGSLRAQWELFSLMEDTWPRLAKNLGEVWQARSGAPGATALLRSLTPYWLGGLFGWRWLMQNAQLFGVPFRWATYRREDSNIKEQLSQMLAAMGACGYAAFPEGTEVKFLEAGKTSTDNPQVMIQTMADRACDLLILGQELSGEAQAAGLGSGASVFQASVRADRLAAAASWCADLLNYQLLPPLLEANFGNLDFMPVVMADLNTAEDPKALAERDALLLNAGVRMPRKWFYQRHGIPVPEEGEEMVGGAAAFPPVQTPAQTRPFSAEKSAGGNNTRVAAATGEKRPANSPQMAVVSAGKTEADAFEALRAETLGKLAETEAKDWAPIFDRVSALVDLKTPDAFAAGLAKLRSEFPALMEALYSHSRTADVLSEQLAKAATLGGKGEQ